MSDIAQIGNRLKQMRLDRGLSQQDLADKAGVSRLSVSRVENGHSCDLSTFIGLLEALGHLDEFMTIFKPVIDPAAIVREMTGKTVHRVRKRNKPRKSTKVTWKEDE